MLKAIIEIVSTNKAKVGNYSRKSFKNGVDFYYKDTIVASLDWKNKKIHYNTFSGNTATVKAANNYKQYFMLVFSDYEHIDVK